MIIYIIYYRSILYLFSSLTKTQAVKSPLSLRFTDSTSTTSLCLCNKYFSFTLTIEWRSELLSLLLKINLMELSTKRNSVMSGFAFHQFITYLIYLKYPPDNPSPSNINGFSYQKTTDMSTIYI